MESNNGIVVAVTSVKGGCGKSTIAQNLACEWSRKGNSVVLLDADKQQSCAQWAERREENAANTGVSVDAPVVKCVAGNLRQTIRDEMLRYDVVIVDVAGRESSELASTLREADIVLVPSAPTIKDIETIGTLLEMLEATEAMAPEHRLCLGLLNKCTTQKSEMKRASEARSIFNDPEVAKHITALPDRIQFLPGPFNDADEDGVGVVEMRTKGKKNHSKAQAQIQTLSIAIEKRLKQRLEEPTP